MLTKHCYHLGNASNRFDATWPHYVEIVFYLITVPVFFRSLRLATYFALNFNSLIGYYLDYKESKTGNNSKVEKLKGNILFIICGGR